MMCYVEVSLPNLKVHLDTISPGLTVSMFPSKFPLVIDTTLLPF